MTTRSRIGSALLVVFLAGCAAVQPLPQEAVGKLNRVGVVSRTGDTLYKQYVGVTVFGNERETEDISAWKLDEVYEEQLAAAVKLVFKAEPVILAQHRSEFSAVNSLNGPYDAMAFWGPNFGKVGDVTRRLCQEQKLDAVLVAARWQSEDILGGTNQKVEGIGIYARRNLALVHVFSKVGFMDCATGKVLTEARLVKSAGTQNHNLQDNVVVAPFEPAIATAPYSRWGREHKDKLKDLLATLPINAWMATLQAMIPKN